MAVSWLRRVDTNFPLYGFMFRLRAFHVGYVVEWHWFRYFSEHFNFTCLYSARGWYSMPICSCSSRGPLSPQCYNYSILSVRGVPKGFGGCSHPSQIEIKKTQIFVDT
jgi:hypothetical protein